MQKIILKRSALNKYCLVFIFLLFSSISQAQFFPAKSYPKGYFMYPVDATKSLSANFGELRANHYHMGLDCRTNQVENRRVWAAADGFISRISIAPFGFGRAIYIQHPNGFTTVYGHLNLFYPELEKFVKEKQYELESWQVSLEFKPNQFPVKKGQLIAYSGNTGGSMGPHVHFEIRDTKTDKVFNPLLFDMPLPDNVSPSIVRLYMYDRCISTYSQSPKNLPIKQTGNNYTTTQPLITVHTDKISFGISANDKLSGSNNPNGIYESIIYMDGKALSGFQLDSISYDETRYLNAHIDYKTKAAGGPYIQHLSRLPGYPEGVYKDINGDGVIELNDDKIHQIKIVVKDANGNTSNLEFKIQKGLITEKGGVESDPNYQDKKEFHPGFVNVFEGKGMQLYLSPKALYDSISFSYSEKKSSTADAVSPLFTVLSGLIPSQDYFTIQLKANQIFKAKLSDKILMRQSWASKSEIVKVKKDGDWYVGKFRNFGNFELLIDTIPPTITGFANNANLSKSSRIIITPKDNNEEIASFRAELDGKWLRFTNDKARSYIYIFDEKCARGKHELKITVEDLAGNVTEKIFHFTR
jgi:hypothetical protein